MTLCSAAERSVSLRNFSPELVCGRYQNLQPANRADSPLSRTFNGCPHEARVSVNITHHQNPHLPSLPCDTVNECRIWDLEKGEEEGG